MYFWRETERWMRLPSFSTRCLKASAALWLFLLLGGKLPSCTTVQSSLWLEPRQKIPELLLCISAGLATPESDAVTDTARQFSFLAIMNVCSSTWILWPVTQAGFLSHSSNSNKFTKKKQCRKCQIWLLTSKRRRNWSVLNVPCYLFYHVTDQQAHMSFSKLGVTISSLSNIQVKERIQLYFHCW